MSKISRSAIEGIAVAVVSHAFEEARRQMDAREQDLFSRAVAEMWAKYPKVSQAVRDIPGLFATRSQINILTVTGRVKVEGAAVPMPAKEMELAKGFEGLRASEDLAAAVAQFAFDKKAMTQKQGNEIATVEAALAGFSTWARLDKGWPEVAAFSAKWRPTPPATRQLVSVTAINDRLGLPPKEQQVAA